MFKTFALEKVNVNLKTSWYKRVEVILIMKKTYNNSKKNKN